MSIAVDLRMSCYSLVYVIKRICAHAGVLLTVTISPTLRLTIQLTQRYDYKPIILSCHYTLWRLRIPLLQHKSRRDANSKPNCD